MSNKTPVNIAASVLARLKNLAVQRGWNFMHMLTRYGIERFLFRLGASEYARQFVLKGGNMFVICRTATIHVLPLTLTCSATAMSRTST